MPSRPRSTDESSMQPAPVIDFDLSSWENPESKKGPFVVKLAEGDDRLVTFANPRDLPWQIVENASPGQLIRECLSQDDRKFFLAHHDLSMAQLDAIAEAWREHYNLPTRGNGVASRT